MKNFKRLAVLAVVLTVALAILMVPPSAHADDWKLYTGMLSHHTGERSDGEEWNENHDLVGLQYENFYAATYVNSYDKRSYSLGYMTDQKCLDTKIGVCFSLSLGVVSGYEYNGSKILPYILPHAQVQLYNNSWLDFSVSPGLSSGGVIYSASFVTTF